MGAGVDSANDVAVLTGEDESTPRARVGEWLAALTVVLAVLGMWVSSPPMVGPDEGAHQATASYLTVNVMPPTAEGREYVSGMLVYGDCPMGFDAQQDASCVPGRDDVRPVKERILNYPPPYYWVVGLGQKAAPGADQWMDVGGRVASMLLNVGALTLLALLLRRHTRNWGTLLLAIATPMAAFLWAVVNPNGWEITAGLLFAYAFARAWWQRPGESSAPSQWISITSVAVTAIVFALSRHDAIVWLSLLTIGVVVMGRGVTGRIRQASLIAAAGLGVFAGLLWQVTHPAQHTDNNPDRVVDPTLLDHLHWLGQIDEVLPDRLRQMVGVLGWLDTPAPQWIVLALLLTWGAVVGFLFARTRIPIVVLVVGFFGSILVPSVLEALRWNDWPYWYQGRITLSFTIPFLFLFLLRFGGRGYRAVIALSVVNALALATMVWLNVARYSFGISDYLPMRWTDPAIGQLSFWIGVACAAAILVISGVRGYWLLSERWRWGKSQEEVIS